MPRRVERWSHNQVLRLPEDGVLHEFIGGVQLVRTAPRLPEKRFRLAARS